MLQMEMDILNYYFYKKGEIKLTVILQNIYKNR